MKKWLKNFIPEAQDEFGQYPLALGSAFFYLLALVLSFWPGLRFNFIVPDMPAAIISFIVVAVLDAIIVSKGGDTFTQWFRRQFPRWFNYLLLIALAALTWWRLGPVCALFEIRGDTQGHLGWGKTS